MAISNELSSEIAAAILTEKKNPQELNQLKEVILRVHSALQQMSEEAREIRFKNRVSQGRTATERRSP
jgi:predicted house-cleaning noncanonical NTP pyrophosphatase (MazG superfamily)